MMVSVGIIVCLNSYISGKGVLYGGFAHEIQAESVVIMCIISLFRSIARLIQ